MVEWLSYTSMSSEYLGAKLQKTIINKSYVSFVKSMLIKL